MSSKEFRFFCGILKFRLYLLGQRKSIQCQQKIVIFIMYGPKFSKPLARQMRCGENKGDALGVAPMQRSAHTSLVHLTPFSLLLQFLQSRKAPLDGVPAWMFHM